MKNFKIEINLCGPKLKRGIQVYVKKTEKLAIDEWKYVQFSLYVPFPAIRFGFLLFFLFLFLFLSFSISVHFFMFFFLFIRVLAVFFLSTSLLF